MAVRRTPSSPTLMLVLLTLGYAGYYFCRSSFSVAKPQLIEYLVAHASMDAAAAKIALGGVASAATLAYAIGKFASGALADFWSGRRNFLLGMGGAILFNIMFALSGTLPLFTLAWVLNRLIQALGWPGAVKVTASWFPKAELNYVNPLFTHFNRHGDRIFSRFCREFCNELSIF